MKNLFVILFLFALLQTAKSQSAESDTVWSKSIGSVVKAVKFSPDGQFIYAAALGRKPMKLSAETGDILKEYDGLIYDQYASLIPLDVSSDGKWLISGDYGKEMQIWDTESGVIIKTLKTNYTGTQNNKFNSVSFSYDKKYVIATHMYGNITENYANSILIWDLTTGELLKEIQSRFVTKVEASPDNQYFAVSYERSEGSNSLPSEIILYRIGTWEFVKTFDGHQSGVMDISFSPDGSLLASCDWDGFIKIWDIEQKKLIKEFGGNNEVNSVGFISNDKVVGGCGTFQNRYVKIWDLDSSKFLGRIRTDLQFDLDLSESKNLCVVATAYELLLFDYQHLITVVGENLLKYDDLITPNPTKNISEIKFLLPVSGKTFISINDANSREIEVLHNVYLEQGDHKFQWIPKGVSSGVYYCNITGNNFSRTLKIMLEK